MKSNPNIHPSAIVHPGAQIAEGVIVGPYCTIGESVSLGANTVCHSHVNIQGLTTIGEDCQIYPFASLGTAPQDLKYNGEATRLVIGNNNKIREYVTMNTGTQQDRGVTTVGSNGLFMMGCHVAHDCVIKDNVILANSVAIGGHVTVGDHAIVGGNAAVHQFVRIGCYAMIGAMSMVANDVIPYAIVKGDRAKVHGLNLVGLKRSGFSRELIAELKSIYEALFNSGGLFADRLTKARTMSSNHEAVRVLLDFVTENSKMQLLQTA